MSVETNDRILTVLGWIMPDSLSGYVLPHEHLSADFTVFFVPPPQRLEHITDLPFQMKHLGAISRNPYHHKSNLKFFEEKDAILEEMKMFKRNGGDLVVELTTIGIQRDMPFYKKVAVETGVNVVAGAGYFTDHCHPPEMDTMTQEQVYDQLLQEVMTGCDGTDIRCGIIGEVGCSWPLTANERKVLTASGLAQETLGCPINIHPGRNTEAPFEIVRILQEAGADITRVTMSHLDRTFPEKDKLLEFASLGSYCEFDLFGIETSWNPLHPDVPMPNDGERVHRIEWLIDEGFESKILIAQDIDTKSRLLKYGGHGFSHILDHVVPYMNIRGMTTETVDRIMKENPKQALTFTK